MYKCQQNVLTTEIKIKT